MSTDDLVFGIHATETLLVTGPERVLGMWVQEGRADKKLLSLLGRATDLNVEIQHVSVTELDKLASGGVHQGVIARIRARPSIGEDGLEELIAKIQTPLLLVLDGVQDPHNLGACLRTADACGVHAVILPKDRAVGVTPTVRKVAAGGAESVPIVRVTNLARTLRWLKKEGIWLIGTGGEARDTIYDADLTGPIGLIMGSEGDGMRRLTQKHCDRVVSLPMLGLVESLNVSVATGIFLYEVLRQRQDSRSSGVRPLA